MRIGYDSIIILNDNICHDFLDGSLSFEIIQKTVPLSPKANCFMQNNSVVQYINPMMNENDGKLKFSVSFKSNELISPAFAAVVFSRNVSCTSEIRRKDEVITNDLTEFSVIRITPSDEEGILELEFISDDTERERLVDMMALKKKEAEKSSETLSELESELSALEAGIAGSEVRISEYKTKISGFRSENAELDELISEADMLEQKNECLKKNIEERGLSSELIKKMKDQLGGYSEILEYYKTSDGYETVNEKLSGLLAELDVISEHLEVMIEHRTDEMNSVSDELNI